MSTSDPKPAFTNRLIHETSPYLRQHAHNPVDWYPWESEALQKAKRENKPIFLSIGYSACHWCHVMERESFENVETAKLMNQHFVNIKVDREERPDLDQIYMMAVQIMTQHGGWPMSVFLTPHLEPFYGGTYFPPDDRGGMPSFKKILTGVANAWSTRRDELLSSAKQLTAALGDLGKAEGGTAGAADFRRWQTAAVDGFFRNFDAECGGFGSAPKFFHAGNLRIALREWKATGNESAKEMVTTTLERWADGGIYDQLGGGFHRYSTDREWLVPHFEKMLYDNALLSELYLEAFQLTGNVEYARVARETLNYVVREMTSADGGFYSTQDADTEGEEGKFYVWTLPEIEAALKQKDVIEPFAKVYNVSSQGNWEGKNILHRRRSLTDWAKDLGVEKDWLEDLLANAQRKLFTVRAERAAPHRDEKILVAWNGMMIHSMALGYQILNDERYLEAARQTADFILDKMRQTGTPARLFHVHKDGLSRLNGYLDDYAHFANSLITLYESDFDKKWLENAKEIVDVMVDEFWDKSKNEFFYTGKTHEALITRPREIHDGATPSATSLAITVVGRLGRLLGNPNYLAHAEKALAPFHAHIDQIPSACAQMILASDYLSPNAKELVFATGEPADEAESIRQSIWKRFVPGRVVVDAGTKSTLLKDLTNGKTAQLGKNTLYVCEGFHCESPVTGLDAITAKVESL